MVHAPRLAAVLLLFLAPALLAQNSTRKVRKPPSETAQRAGTAVKWRESLEQALAEAKENKRPVFWYVPTVAGSPMDRKPEIDRYLMAGPFSWPSTIALLNEHFVPFRGPARGQSATTYKLKRMEFIEPGWLVLDGDGKELARLDKISTFHPQWFEAPLRRLANLPAHNALPASEALADVWKSYEAFDLDKARALAEDLLQRKPAPALAAEARFVKGMTLARSNRMAEAVKVWQLLAEELAEEPWAWKAAMEAEGHGPFAHGFEDFLPLPPAVLREQQDGSRAPGSSYAEDELWRRGVRFLLAMEEGDGMIRDSIYDFGGTDGLPNVWAADTCLAGAALLEAAQRHDQKQFDLGPLRARIEPVLQRILKGAAADAQCNLQDKDEVIWAFTYRIRFLCRWMALRPADKEARTEALQHGVQGLQALQPENGVWFHEYGNPFAIATALQALSDAKQAGADVDEEKVQKGLRALAHCRSKNAAFTYGYGRGEPQERIEAGAGRTALCELAIGLWREGGVDAEKLGPAVEMGFEHHGLLARVRKYDDHADEYHYGGFFFWFDMLGRTEALMALPQSAARDRRQAQQKKLVLDLPEFDGCFTDSHELGRAYGTAMGLLCLAALGR